MDFFQWGYGLVNNGGFGHEVVLYGGLLGGLYFDDDQGLLLSPGLGLGYSWAPNEKYRLVSTFDYRVALQTEKGADGNHYNYSFGLLNSFVSLRLHQSIHLNVGASASALVPEKGKTTYKLKPYVGLDTNLADSATLSIFSGGSAPLMNSVVSPVVGIGLKVDF